MKKNLRKEFLAKRKELSSEERTRRSKAITQHFFNSKFIENQTFHLYISIEKLNEVDTIFMIQKLWEMGKTVVVPKMQGKKLLICHYTPTTELAINHWGIKEPKSAKIIENQEIDIVLVPMLICDKNGNRIGYGGGFYDRFLAQLPNSTKFIGINFFEPTVHIPIHEFDVPLHGLITHEGIFEFRQNADS